MITCSRCGEQNSDEFAYCGDCGSAIGSGPFAIQSTINGGRYRIDKLIGQGGMGSVYRATDMRLRRDVALKVLHAELVAHPTARRRMTQEAEALARIEHPNVVRVIDVFDENQLLVMVLEFVIGGDLARMVQPGGLSEAQVVPLMIGVLAGLEAVHQAGLVHRDMKPGNVLLTDKGVPKITDLGVARDSKAKERTRLGAALGTPEYMSPEQIQGLVVDARCDIYSTGIVLYELLTGVKPYDATTDFDIQAAHVRDPPNLARLRGVVSEPVIGVIARALAKAPGQRWPSAHAMAAALASGASALSPDTQSGRAQAEAKAQFVANAERARAARQLPPHGPGPVGHPDTITEGFGTRPNRENAHISAQSYGASLYAPPSEPMQSRQAWGGGPEHPAKLGNQQLFFSLTGRIPRKPYWINTIFIILCLSLLSIIAAASKTEALFILALPLLWCSWALGVKRWHDRGKSGWWMLINLVPYLGGIWSFVECGCLRGTVGPNKYGHDSTGHY